jgi:hypothetical protein
MFIYYLNELYFFYILLLLFSYFKLLSNFRHVSIGGLKKKNFNDLILVLTITITALLAAILDLPIKHIFIGEYASQLEFAYSTFKTFFRFFLLTFYIYLTMQEYAYAAAGDNAFLLLFLCITLFSIFFYAFSVFFIFFIFLELVLTLIYDLEFPIK